MEIAEVAAYEFRRTLDGRHFGPNARWTERRIPIVRITTRDGQTGMGEGWCEQEAISLFFDQLRSLAPYLLGGDARLIEQHWQTAWSLQSAETPDWIPPAVTSAVDIALWDLRARGFGASVHELLGPQRDAVPVYASGGLYANGKGPAELAAEMQGLVERGFYAVKLKIGRMERDADLARVAAVREAVGPQVEILVDAGECLTTGEAPAMIRRLAELGVTAIQAPLPVTDVPGLLMLNRTGRLRVLVGESEWRVARFRELLRAGAVGVLQLNPGLCGGITQTLKLAALAEAHDVPVCLQNHSTAVLLAACLQIGAARGAVAAVEVHGFHDHLHELLPTQMLQPRDGCLAPDAPGLGLPERMQASRGDIRLIWRLRAGEAG
ncbi:Mandelate racemase/muconate lactonizing enzyme family protein [Rhodovastum atsumiense]|uniref:mandelate racemase/muconate lactonizing enzyme family protein n=1 Tax=Rhodovastum atsumiense TaxID=504468 RepID=UPI00139F2BB1|nr:mandelate racemase/muconate lactonizing enzyme family protein [Rhodovastum atsumiense]CAH2599621.1 Mandelate racemase/muconate lactonizing enzyme family protein [Rhodovastum atsumiense]